MKTAMACVAVPLLVACGATGIVAPNPDVGGALGPDTVTLRIGQEVRVGSLDLAFADVPSDSRCPSDVVCVWAGNAVAEVAVGPAFGQGPTYQLLLNTTEGPHSGEAWGLRVTLVELAPEPISTHPTRRGDYVARLEVRAAP